MRALLSILMTTGVAGAAIAAPAAPLAPASPFGPAQSEACARLSAQTVAPDGVKLFKKLNELPPGLLEHAVWRTVGGCPVREIVFRGETYYVASPTPRAEKLAPGVKGAKPAP